MTPIEKQGLGQEDQSKKEKSNVKLGLDWLGNFGFKPACLDLFAGVPLEAKGGRFSPRLSYAAAVVTPALQLLCLCPANPQACLAPAQWMLHPVVGKDTCFPALIVC